MAWQCGFHRVQIGVDSITAISLIQDCHNPAHLAAVITGRIRTWIRRDWVVQIYHVFRESNRVADTLSHLGHDRSIGVHFYEVVLYCIWSLLNFDSTSLAALRRRG